MVINVEHLAGNIITLKATDVLTAALDTFLASWGSLPHLTDGCSQRHWIIRRDIETVRTSCLLQTRPRTTHHRQSTTDGLDDGNAKSFIHRGIYKRFSLGIQRRQIGIMHIVEDIHPSVQSVC